MEREEKTDYELLRAYVNSIKDRIRVIRAELYALEKERYKLISHFQSLTDEKPSTAFDTERNQQTFLTMQFVVESTILHTEGSFTSRTIYKTLQLEGWDIRRQTIRNALSVLGQKYKIQILQPGFRGRATVYCNLE